MGGRYPNLSFISSSMVPKRGLKELFRHKRREQHVAEFHDRSDVRLRRKNLPWLLPHESPFQAMSIGAESHQVRAVQAAPIDGTGHVPAELGTTLETARPGISV